MLSLIFESPDGCYNGYRRCHNKQNRDIAGGDMSKWLLSQTSLDTQDTFEIEALSNYKKIHITMSSTTSYNDSINCVTMPISLFKSKGNVQTRVDDNHHMIVRYVSDTQVSVTCKGWYGQVFVSK